MKERSSSEISRQIRLVSRGVGDNGRDSKSSPELTGHNHDQRQGQERPLTRRYCFVHAAKP